MSSNIGSETIIKNIMETNFIGEFRLSFEVKGETMGKILNSNDVEEFIRPKYEGVLEHRMEVYIIPVNNSNQIMGYSKLFSGNITDCVMDVRIIFQLLLLTNATGFFVIHNVTSASLEPSRNDELITKKLREVGKILDIKLLDHIVISKDNYYSYADNAWIGKYIPLI